jgi:hypothetical protein
MPALSTNRTLSTDRTDPRFRPTLLGVSDASNSPHLVLAAGHLPFWKSERELIASSRICHHCNPPQPLLFPRICLDPLQLNHASKGHHGRRALGHLGNVGFRPRTIDDGNAQSSALDLFTGLAEEAELSGEHCHFVLQQSPLCRNPSCCHVCVRHILPLPLSECTTTNSTGSHTQHARQNARCMDPQFQSLAAQFRNCGKHCSWEGLTKREGRTPERY